MELTRCSWANGSELEKYHDQEWGVAVHDDKKLFEMLILESFQAGLSWSTILKKREGFRRAFDNFEIEKIAKYDEEKIANLMKDRSIVCNLKKIKSAVQNSKAAIKIIDEFGSLDEYFWGFVDFSQILGEYKKIEEIPSESKISKKLSIDLKKRGFAFLGPVVCYSFLQACGLVNDHIQGCFKRQPLECGYYHSNKF